MCEILSHYVYELQQRGIGRVVFGSNADVRFHSNPFFGSLKSVREPGSRPAPLRSAWHRRATSESVARQKPWSSRLWSASGLRSVITLFRSILGGIDWAWAADSLEPVGWIWVQAGGFSVSSPVGEGQYYAVYAVRAFLPRLSHLYSFWEQL